MKSVHKRSGFTIVELLIVIVVIAILAAITVIAYNGITRRANESAIKNEVAQAAKQIESLKFNTPPELYPADLAATRLKNGNGIYAYFYEASTNTFCVQSSKNDIVYYTTSASIAPIAGSCVPIGVAAWWKMNNNGNDASQNNNSGTPSNITTATGQNGAPNSAYDYDGSSSKFIVPTSSLITDNVKTFSFWVRPTAYGVSPGSAFLSKRTSGSNGYFVYMTPSGVLTIDCAGQAQRWSTGYTIALNVWTHIVLTCDDTMNPGLQLFVNGVSNTSRSSVNRTDFINNTALRIGHDSTSPSMVLTGSLDDVRLYNQVLTPQEISSMYSLGAQ
ncbi:MAG: LamG-like jellyroll fold domain-containing protein [Candidatus Microsaccharimonas sp.]